MTPSDDYVVNGFSFQFSAASSFLVLLWYTTTLGLRVLSLIGRGNVVIISVISTLLLLLFAFKLRCEDNGDDKGLSVICILVCVTELLPFILDDDAYKAVVVVAACNNGAGICGNSLSSCLCFDDGADDDGWSLNFVRRAWKDSNCSNSSLRFKWLTLIHIHSKNNKQPIINIPNIIINGVLDGGDDESVVVDIDDADDDDDADKIRTPLFIIDWVNGELELVICNDKYIDDDNDDDDKGLIYNTNFTLEPWLLLISNIWLLFNVDDVVCVNDWNIIRVDEHDNDVDINDINFAIKSGSDNDDSDDDNVSNKVTIWPSSMKIEVGDDDDAWVDDGDVDADADVAGDEDVGVSLVGADEDKDEEVDEGELVDEGEKDVLETSILDGDEVDVGEDVDVEKDVGAEEDAAAEDGVAAVLAAVVAEGTAVVEAVAEDVDIEVVDVGTDVDDGADDVDADSEVVVVDDGDGDAEVDAAIDADVDDGTDVAIEVVVADGTVDVDVVADVDTDVAVDGETEVVVGASEVNGLANKSIGGDTIDVNPSDDTVKNILASWRVFNCALVKLTKLLLFEFNVWVYGSGSVTLIVNVILMLVTNKLSFWSWIDTIIAG